MKKELRRAPAVGLLGLCVLLIATMVSPEALAQGGRVAEGRSNSTARVERKETPPAKATATKSPKKSDTKEARSVVRRSKGETKPADGAGRTVRRDESQAAPRAGEKATRRVERQETGGTTRRPSAATARTPIRVERNTPAPANRGTDSDRADRSGNRDGQRSTYTGPRYNGAGSVAHLYTHRNRFLFHTRRHRPEYAWCTAYHHPGHYHYVDAQVHIGSHLYLGIAWPWEIRFRSHWEPRFRYRQVVLVDAGWNGRRIRNRVEVQTYYRHKILFASDRYSEVEIEIDAIDLWQNGRFLATVDRIPGNLRKVRAVLHADGRIEFDRNLFIMGDAASGFELIATRYYTDNLFSAYEDAHGLRVGRVDLSRGKVNNVRRSRYFDHGRFVGYAPISLLPDDDRLWDYGRPVSYRIDDGGRDSGWYRDFRGVEVPNDSGEYELSRDFLDTYDTGDGGDVRIERATSLDRFD